MVNMLEQRVVGSRFVDKTMADVETAEHIRHTVVESVATVHHEHVALENQREGCDVERVAHHALGMADD